jgi:hypothetical protein
MYNMQKTHKNHASNQVNRRGLLSPLCTITQNHTIQSSSKPSPSPMNSPAIHGMGPLLQLV